MAPRGGAPGGDTPLLRDGRAQHLAHLSALSAAARPARARGARRGARAGPRLPRQLEGAALRRVPAPVAGRRPLSAVAGARRPARSPGAEEEGLVADLTHEGEGVVHAGKAAFVAAALPGERIRFRRTRRHRRHDDAELLEVLEAS